MKRQLAIAALAALATAPLAAHPEQDLTPVRQACKADIEKYCQGIHPGGGRIRVCLKSNKDRLSEGCLTAIKARMEARRATPAPSGN
jgi:hypothetical protein